MTTFPTQREDSDDWLHVGAEDFDNMLQQGFSRPPEAKDRSTRISERSDAEMKIDDEDRLAQSQATRLQDLAKKVEEFVEGQGDLDGAKFAE